jgi:hypothetical protein
MKKILKNNGLSICFFLLFVFSLVGQLIMGLHQYNEKMKELGGRQVGYGEYLTSGHFAEATFENWESEFLQMGLYVYISIFLFQKGSSESKDPDKHGKEDVDREPNPRRKGAPWPVRKGGWVLKLYKNSLTISLLLLFLISFLGHFAGSRKEYNQEQELRHQPTESTLEYLGNSQFWFESFENWQSEFLSIFAIIYLTIYLRQKGSAQSKPVDAENSETG